MRYWYPYLLQIERTNDNLTLDYNVLTMAFFRKCCKKGGGVLVASNKSGTDAESVTFLNTVNNNAGGLRNRDANESRWNCRAALIAQPKMARGCIPTTSTTENRCKFTTKKINGTDANREAMYSSCPSDDVALHEVASRKGKSSLDYIFQQ